MNGTGLLQDLPFMLVIGGFFLTPLYLAAFVLWLVLARGPFRPWALALYALPILWLVVPIFVPYRAQLQLKAHGLTDPILYSAWAALAAGPVTTIVLALRGAPRRPARAT